MKPISRSEVSKGKESKREPLKLNSSGNDVKILRRNIDKMKIDKEEQTGKESDYFGPGNVEFQKLRAQPTPLPKGHKSEEKITTKQSEEMLRGVMMNAVDYGGMRSKLMEKYAGKYIVFQNKEVVGSADILGDVMMLVAEDPTRFVVLVGDEYNTFKKKTDLDTSTRNK